MKIKKLSLVLLSVLLLGVALAADSTVAIEELTFQGRLTGSDGNPLNGSREMSYVLYKVKEGGKPLFEWYAGAKQLGDADFLVDAPYDVTKYPVAERNHKISDKIPVYKGIYAVRLPFNKAILKYALEHEDNLFIEVRVKGDAGSYETLRPRVTVASSMFAMMANQVKWAKAKKGNTESSTGLSYDVSKNNGEITFVGIGCEPADNVKLKIQGVPKNAVSPALSAPVTALQVVGNANIDQLDATTINVKAVSGTTVGGVVFQKVENKDCGNITKVFSIEGADSSINECKISGFKSIEATQVFNAVWNDLAEFRPLAAGSKKIAGRAYLSTAKGLVLPTKRCQQGVIGICSDTYGFSLGGKPEDKDKLPIAISGWALAYVDKAYPIGTALVNGKDGILTKATFWEKTKYPERILAVVDMGPAEYNNLKVDGRTWVKVK